MSINRYFDVLYYFLCVCIFVALAYTIQKGARLRHHLPTPEGRKHASSIALCGIGTAIALVGGLIADSFLKSSVFFQQVRFLFYYCGFSLIVYAVTAILNTLPMRKILFPLLSSQTLIRMLWIIFIGTLLIAGFYLFNPALFVRNVYGEQVQLVIYWLPLLTATLGSAGSLYLSLNGLMGKSARKRVVFLGLFATLLFLGLLREAQIIPDLGDPIVNLLVAFGPFTGGSLCLALSCCFWEY